MSFPASVSISLITSPFILKTAVTATATVTVGVSHSYNLLSFSYSFQSLSFSLPPSRAIVFSFCSYFLQYIGHVTDSIPSDTDPTSASLSIYL